MKLYVGSRNVKPQGYLTVDINPDNQPDIVADILDMQTIEDSSCDEVLASHVLEHLEWPDSFKALSEFSRILKPNGILRISVPDLKLLLQMMLSGESDFHAAGLLFGMGGRENPFEMHRYGFTEEMLREILLILGFSKFSWWETDRSEGSAGWCYGKSDKVAISLNLEAVKVSDPIVPAAKLYDKLLQNPLEDPRSLLSNIIDDNCEMELPHNEDPSIYQRIHFLLIEAKQRIKYLEKN